MEGRKIRTNKGFIQYLVCSLICVIVLWFEASAQPRFSLSQITVYDQNIFRNYLKAEDWVNQTSVNFQYDVRWRTLPVRFNYTGDLNLFYYNTDRLSHAHQIGLESVLDLSEKVRFNFGAAGQIRRYQPEFNIYDYQTLVVYGQLRFDSWQNTPIQFGYRFRNRDYQNLSELDYQEHFGFVVIKHFFATRTTFIGELNFGQKKYAHLQAAEAVIVVTPIKPGKGRGGRYGKGNMAMPSDTSIIAYNMTALKAQRTSLSLKLAQSLFSKTGLSIEYLRQFQPANNIRYVTGIEYSYSKDDELYDDPYAYGSNGLELTLTKILSWQSSLKIYGSLLDKDYLYSIPVDSTISPNPSAEKRSDRQRLIGMTWQKIFNIERRLKRASFYLSANYLVNESNDRYFDFDGFFVQSGFEFVF